MASDEIDITNPSWRALRIDGAASIEYLEKMLKIGWYVSPFGLDDIRYCVLTVPVSTPTRINFTNEHQVLEAQQQPTLTIVVLNKGATPNRQRVIILPKNEAGYSVKGENMPSYKLWKLIAIFPLDDGSISHLYEQRTFAES